MSICIICKLEKKLTDEHIVPEFMGGSLLVCNVCGTCNSEMGKGFEGRLSNNFIYKGARFFNGIKGKSGTPFPLDSVYHHNDSDTKFTLDKDGSITSLPKSYVEETDEGVKVHLSVDEKDVDKISPLLEKKISRYMKSKGKEVNKSKVSDIVEKIVAESAAVKTKIDKPSVKVNISINFNDIDLLHIKIAYELACYHFGNDYISDPVANSLRLSLYNQKIEEGVRIQTPMVNDPFESFISDEYHWVIFSSLGCYVKGFGLNSFIMYTSEGSNFISANGIVYKFCYKSQSHSVGELIDVVRNKSMGSDSIDFKK